MDNDKLRAALQAHFIVQIECEHPVDRAHCICGWISSWAKNVGEAGKLWVAHVEALLASEKPPASSVKPIWKEVNFIACAASTTTMPAEKPPASGQSIDDKLRAALQTRTIRYSRDREDTPKFPYEAVFPIKQWEHIEALLAAEKPPGQVNQAIGAETNLERIQPSIAGRQEGYAQGYECASADRVRELSPATELKIRIFLWLGHGHDWVYGDDGEMQCGACLCDYKRDSLDECVERARVASLETGLKALGRAAPPAKEPAK